MTPETQARELLEAECTQGAGDYIRNGRRSFVSTEKAVRAIVAALQSTLAEREAVVESLREVARSFRESQFRDGVEYAANSIERGDHLPQRGEAGDG